MKILFASSEVYPLIKTGGLADVSASLPKALLKLGCDIRLVLPAYPAVRKQGRWKSLGRISLGKQSQEIRLLLGKLPDTDLPVYLVDAPIYFERAGDPYRAPNGVDWQDNHLRFGLFAMVIAALCMGEAGIRWRPDILHGNDWQTGLVPVFLNSQPERPATVFTIHNLAYQGLFPYQALNELGLPDEFWSPDALEFYGRMSFIKGGLVYADRITTVSPTYATEIRTSAFGCGLDGLLDYRSNVLHGILNGIEDSVWSPRIDSYLDTPYDPSDRLAKRRQRAFLCNEIGLDESENAPPLVGFIGRLVEQKGIDLILEAIAPLIARKQIRAVILGSGDKIFEQALISLASKHPKFMSVRIGYDESLAHRIEAGADAFLMPSRFEPCGLNQMYSLRYGTPPLANKTGGLADTIVDASPANIAAGIANGFLIETPSVEALSAGLQRLLNTWDTPAWDNLIQAGIGNDFSWTHSAKAYMKLYKSISYHEAP
ncbi:glycogen synthase GlgA [Acidihalobacter prosperus]